MTAWIISGLIVILIALIVAGVFLVQRAVYSTDKDGSTKFRSVLFMQNSYDKLRRKTRIPCSIMYIKVGFDNYSMLEGTSGSKKVLENVASIILSSFADKDNIVSEKYHTDYIVLTRMSEPDIIERINAAKYAMRNSTSNSALAKKLVVNVGAYLIPASDVDFEEAVQRCQLACTKAIEKSISYIAWDYNLQKNYDQATTLDEDIAGNLENNNFFVEFQPIVDINTGNIVCAEALTRLNRDDKGVVMPAQFIPIISNSGNYDKFDFLILEKVCKWISTHSYIFQKIEHISVNCSRESISMPGFAENVLSVINKYTVPHNNIAIEILEDKQIEPEKLEIFTQNISDLRKQDVIIMLDDFGTGHTSFEDIRNCPTDILKVDQSIIRNTDTEIGERVFRSILNVAHEIGAKVICEGVEKPEQIDLVRQNKCEWVQGFYFYHSMRPDQFEKLIFNNQ